MRTFKDQLTDDFEKVFLNKDEFADTILIDCVEVDGIFEENGGEYEESKPFVRLSSSAIVFDTSKIVIGEKEYGVVSITPSKYGEIIVMLGTLL